MQISLFRALKSINMPDAAAEQVVHAFEEHIDMAVSEAMKHYDDRISAMQTVLEAKIDAGFKSIEAKFEGRFTGFEGKLSGMQTSIDVLKWVVITQASLLLLAGTIAGYVKLAT
ncbi:hypothetical protein HNO88_002504 [Novosphingobium chloroacetimidivorans]|uniref:DUF1640 domain-containing protein n=1 Tax=Novosphingobium chloroacetimidivorans TaxID=1428314 RepID=A0A7W7NXG5_9SPHN|nr:hypothetical protein [Novosphingobium chloroacetimidivorans]MBB4859175.1 hypothetical protein [Novosphingobium chloroacetimidivorans]